MGFIDKIKRLFSQNFKVFLLKTTYEYDQPLGLTNDWGHSWVVIAEKRAARRDKWRKEAIRLKEALRIARIGQDILDEEVAELEAELARYKSEVPHDESR